MSEATAETIIEPENLPSEVVADATPLQMMDVLSQDGFVERMQKAVDTYKALQIMCFSMTNEKQWLNQGTEEDPSYYLQSPGAEAMMAPLGISHDPPKKYRIDKKNDKGKYYIWTFEGEAECQLLKRAGFYIGAATSQDKFLSSRPGYDPERDEADIIKKAMSNWEVNVVGRLAGLRQPSTEMLKAAGLDINKIKRADYSGNSSEAKGEQTISEAQAKRFYAKAKSIDRDRVAAYLTDMGYGSSTEILKRDYDRACAWADKGGPEWTKQKTPAQAKPTRPANPSDTEQNIKDMKEEKKAASPKPEPVAMLSDEQMDEVQKAATEKEISSEALESFLLGAWGVALDRVPATRYDDLIFAITGGDVTGWMELGQEQEPGSEG